MNAYEIPRDRCLEELSDVFSRRCLAMVLRVLDGMGWLGLWRCLCSFFVGCVTWLSFPSALWPFVIPSLGLRVDVVGGPAFCVVGGGA